ncbi:hypothetical protein Patl1_30341 [Pistacia atlantica]|uniref:Uncharacterized protein n=1 Tax=Pistacia atlantica TaxID=434234 RepID=A0ACC1AFF4_9ROSI|nr:hypothetical protein Patl1_30341 [Pistacia atlantica]
MMSRPLLLVFLLLILIITSQFEWRQQLVVDLDTTPTINQKQYQISKREEAVKEKVLYQLSGPWKEWVLVPVRTFPPFAMLYPLGGLD